MEKDELIQLIEGPIMEAFSRLKKSKISANQSIESNSKEEKNKNDASSSSASNNYSVPLSEAQRDRRTVFVQQLSVRCTDRDLQDFFNENHCPTRHARIVLDKYTRKSKGVAYVEFFEEESVRVALKLTGKKLLGVPIIVELTETEKNRIAQEAATMNANSSGNTTKSSATVTPVDDLVRLYVGSLHPSLTELELEQLFEPFGELASVELLKDERSGSSKGVAFIEYKRVGAARVALETLNGFELAGRAIRVGPVRVDKSKASSSKQPLLPSQQLQQQIQQNNQSTNGQIDEEENLVMDAKKRAELMQKLLSSRKLN